MGLMTVLRSRAFWTWYAFAGMVGATAMLAVLQHRLARLGAPDVGLPAELVPAATQGAIAHGGAYAGVMGVLAAAAVVVAVWTRFARWPTEVRHWTLLFAGGFALAGAAILFGGYMMMVHVLPAAKLASVAG